MKIALFGRKTSSTKLRDFLPELLAFFHREKIELQVEEKLLESIKQIPEIGDVTFPTFKNHIDLWNDLDLFFTFGGDGTILAATTIVRDSNIPIVGINTGRLGFLASISKSEIMNHISDILNLNFKINKRTLLSVESNNLKNPYEIALNEVAVLRKETTSMITIDAYLNDEHLNSYWADGLIIATPTGSTGYSLSCNGPIIAPNTQNFVITPIAPHHLNVRPLIIPDDSTIKLKVHSRVPEYSLTLDSRLNFMPVEKEIIIKKADFNISIVDLHCKTYVDTLRKKLYWGTDSRNQGNYNTHVQKNTDC